MARFGICEICQRERDLRVVCSGIGAQSYGACEVCLAHGAEPDYVFDYLVWMSGGNPARIYGEEVLEQYSYINRDYVQLGDWLREQDVAAICKRLDEGYADVVQPDIEYPSEDNGIPF